MASEPKKTKTNPPRKVEAPAKDTTTPAEGAAKVETGETAAAAPSNYSRGEGQKPVTRAYKDNWNAIFAKKSVEKTVTKRAAKSSKKSIKKPTKKGGKKKKRK